MAPLGGVPSVSAQAAIVIWIDNGVFALRQANASERIAIAQAAVQKHQQYNRLFEPVRNGKNERSDFRPQRVGEPRIAD